MQEKFTLVWSFRNRIDSLINSISSANNTCPKDVDFCLLDAASNEETIRKLRECCNNIYDRLIRICESTYRSSLAEAWNLGMILMDNRFVIFSSSDVSFLRPGWFESFRSSIVNNKSEYILMESHALFAFDKKAIPKMGWFDENFKAGPHFDPDFMIRASENNVKLEIIQNNGFYFHGDERELTQKRRTQDVPDRLPMNDLTNERIFKNKWETDWPGWTEAIRRGDIDLPHPPTHISQVKRKIPEIDPHPLYTKKYSEHTNHKHDCSSNNHSIIDFLENRTWNKKYADEHFKMLPGLYNYLDGRILYSVVREFKPQTIIDIGPREGRTTSCIVNALIKNIELDSKCEVRYYVFEKDKPYLSGIKQYLKSFSGINFHIDSNVIDSNILDNVKDVDLLFIDANHDYILARWYMQNLFPLLNDNSIIHIHDIYYNKTGKCWGDIAFSGSPQDHPDIIDVEVLRGLYPTIFDKYSTGEIPVQRYEGDEVKEFYENNESNIRFYSTCDLAKKSGIYEKNDVDSVPPPCSLYFYVENPKVLILPQQFESCKRVDYENIAAWT